MRSFWNPKFCDFFFSFLSHVPAVLYVSVFQFSEKSFDLLEMIFFCPSPGDDKANCKILSSLMFLRRRRRKNTALFVYFSQSYPYSSSLSSKEGIYPLPACLSLYLCTTDLTGFRVSLSPWSNDEDKVRRADKSERIREN